MSRELVYTIPLRDAYRAPLGKRAKVAVRIVKEFVMRHVKPDLVRISPEVNEVIWSKGIKHPPRRLKVKVEVREEEGVKVAEVKLPEADIEGEKKG